jgi:signal transduction histidine kinase
VVEAFSSVCREALTNVNKHARGVPCTLTLLFEPLTVTLEMINATGAESQPLLAGTGAGVGLPGMHTRMVEVGGSLEVGRQVSRWVVRAQWRRA